MTYQHLINDTREERRKPYPAGDRKVDAIIETERKRGGRPQKKTPPAGKALKADKHKK
jgi:hypothetical protein